MTIGHQIDELYALRQRRLALERDVEDLKKLEKEKEVFLKEELANLSLSAAKGSVASFSFSKEALPVVKDWDAVYKHITDVKDFTILHKRISSTIWRELYDEGFLLPGTEAFENIKVSLRKL